MNNIGKWEFGTSMMTGYYTIFKNSDEIYDSNTKSYYRDEYVAFSKLPDSQKKAPGSITNKNFKEIYVVCVCFEHHDHRMTCLECGCPAKRSYFRWCRLLPLAMWCSLRTDVLVQPRVLS